MIYLLIRNTSIKLHAHVIMHLKIRGFNENIEFTSTCEKNFKERYNNHAAPFRNKSKEKSTELSKYIWELNDNHIRHNLKKRIASRDVPYVCGSKTCNLSLTKKLTITKADPESLLNTSDEIVSKGRHVSKFTLKCFKEN